MTSTEKKERVRVRESLAHAYMGSHPNDNPKNIPLDMEPVVEWIFKDEVDAPQS